MTGLEDHIKSVGIQIEKFRSIQVPFTEEKKLKDKHDAFKNSFAEMAVKFNQAKKNIDEKQKQNAEFGKRRRTTMPVAGETGDLEDPNKEENSQLLQKQILEDRAAQALQAEA